MIRILLSTYNGARFLPEQLASLERQTHREWFVLWRDDGSEDDTIAIMEGFSARTQRCVRVKETDARVGPTESFFILLKKAVSCSDQSDIVMFCDQDDVWLPKKIEKAEKSLAERNPCFPVLYFSRQKLTDEALNIFGESKRLKFVPAFPVCLSQNVAAGCTMALNYEAARLISDIKGPKITYHDWWSYIVVLFCGGCCVYDDTTTILYRQHLNNAVGSEKNYFKRSVAAIRRGPRRFMDVFRQHVRVLAENDHLCGDNLKPIVAELNYRLSSKLLLFIYLYKNKIIRQNISETIIFYVWVLLG